MKKVNYAVILLLILMLFASCSVEVPNPIIGTYSLQKKDSKDEHLASIALKSDGTYVFAQIVYDDETGTPKGTLKFTGEYDYVLQAFNFTTADGSIYLRLDASEIPKGVTDTFLSAGSNPFLYSWKCDKNSGPQSLTLAVDPEDSTTIYNFIYSGGQNALDSFEPTIKVAEPSTDTDTDTDTDTGTGTDTGTDIDTDKDTTGGTGSGTDEDKTTSGSETSGGETSGSETSGGETSESESSGENEKTDEENTEDVVEKGDEAGTSSDQNSEEEEAEA